MAVSVTRKAVGIGLTDAVALLFVYLVPTLSHLTSLPFYMIDPMRGAVLGALLVSKDWKNGLVLALSLPLFSFAVSGHPVFPKCLLIAAELSVNVLLFVWLSRIFVRSASPSSFASSPENGSAAKAPGSANHPYAASPSSFTSSPENGSVVKAPGSAAVVGVAAFVSILLSKALYYGLKALVLSAGLMQTELISTALLVQLAVALLISLGFAIWWKGDNE